MAPRGWGYWTADRILLIGTVPAQHMYGFESTVLLALMSGNAFCAERPFYPADVSAAVTGVPRPRALVTTPVHLRTLLASGIDLPPMDLVDVGDRTVGPGTGARGRSEIPRPAVRNLRLDRDRPDRHAAHCARSIAWRLWPGVRLISSNGQVFAQGGHVEELTPMCDVIEIIGEDEFLLHGRTADLVNVAGKRSSFGYLNAQLNAIPGVVDGAFFLREGATGSTGVARLGAVVVAPALSVAALTEQLRQRIDPVFLPRPLLIVEHLPRNATGKLPQQALQASRRKPLARRRSKL